MHPGSYGHFLALKYTKIRIYIVPYQITGPCRQHSHCCSLHARHDTLVPAQLTAACLACKGGCLTPRPLPCRQKKTPHHITETGFSFGHCASKPARAAGLAGLPAGHWSCQWLWRQWLSGLEVLEVGLDGVFHKGSYSHWAYTAWNRGNEAGALGGLFVAYVTA